MSIINKQGLELIKKFESFRAESYICPAGLKTIGYGHVIASGENFTKITQKKAEQLLLQDLKIAELAVIRNIKITLNDNQFSALVSFCFNVGVAALQRSTLRMKVNAEEHELVPNELTRWVFAGGRKLSGLIQRRKEEGLLYRAN